MSGGQKALFTSDFEQLPMPNAQVYLIENWIKPATADKLFMHFHRALAWEQPSIRLFGKTMKVPRLQAWYGDAEAGYTYSGLKMEPLPWEPQLAKLKSYCEQTCSTSFNSVLANLYRNGSDSMGLHADDEPELGRHPVIASVSFGQTRRFDFKHKQTKEKVSVDLNHGSLLIMRGETQDYWQHGINKTKRIDKARLNFTFRFVHPSY
ncbi:alpha-ketoglutarate-dependent dioxygenase AlkB [Glaciecola sp. XM2]|uniref:alpha-ketoglutarate-dependent dioxygenase AlkB family protein n=1 Tax=Glaciecola sp. XM2 TaxID=1914931 RepID=UPI002032DE3F|nr:alpha-ketoglutarate-dependent dioxygenase AlkB [Glaciecola sp. XM2]